MDQVPQTVMSISMEIRSEVKRDYLSGMTLWAVMHKWKRRLSQQQVREILNGMIRPKGSQAKELSAEEVEERKQSIRNQWTPEQASRRWVGRYLSSQEQMCKQFSHILRSMGGNL